MKKKKCIIWKKEHGEAKKNEKKINVVTSESDIVIVFDDGCINFIC